jgi:hypothetical protein
MSDQLLQVTYEIDIQPGEKLTLPAALVDSVGAGRWLLTIQPADDLPVRDHSAFLNSYAPQDDTLYDYPAQFARG